MFLMLLVHVVLRACSRARANTGKKMAASIAMIAITTRSSMSVKPFCLGRPRCSQANRVLRARICFPPWQEEVANRVRPRSGSPPGRRLLHHRRPGDAVLQGEETSRPEAKIALGPSLNDRWQGREATSDRSVLIGRSRWRLDGGETRSADNHGKEAWRFFRCQSIGFRATRFYEGTSHLRICAAGACGAAGRVRTEGNGEFGWRAGPSS